MMSLWDFPLEPSPRWVPKTQFKALWDLPLGDSTLMVHNTLMDIEPARYACPRLLTAHQGEEEQKQDACNSTCGQHNR
jgi:hypothetical protein